MAVLISAYLWGTYKHTTYIHEQSNWAEWQWSDKKLLPFVSRVRILQGHLLGKTHH
ncbi:MAG TPA: hypothetical protein DD294_01755 [Psychrobacter sp.]|nr:hypothetical protein [Psychrobacter sp.]